MGMKAATSPAHATLTTPISVTTSMVSASASRAGQDVDAHMIWMSVVITEYVPETLTASMRLGNFFVNVALDMSWIM